MTTFVGSKPEKFTFEVISVMHNYLPKMDLILVKSSDPKLSTLLGVLKALGISLHAEQRPDTEAA